MILKRIIIENYRLIKRADFTVNPDMNIFVGDNDSGKSTLLEAIAILTTGKLNGYNFDRQIKANIFKYTVRENYRTAVQEKKEASLPAILLEAYCSTDNTVDNTVELATYKGSNNSLHEDCPGIRILVEFDKQYEATLKDMYDKCEVFDIPVEFYKVSINYFNGNSVAGYRNCPIKASYIDTTRKDYSNMVDRFVSESITAYLSPEEQTNLSTAYRKNRHEFHSHEVVKKLNEDMSTQERVSGRVLRIDLKEEDVAEWKRQMSVVVDEIPFENVGFGSQNTIKVELAIKNSQDQVNVVLMEEPENNLSFTNMAKLIGRILKSTGKQIFISTHSSYVANKLSLGKLLLVNNGNVTSFASLPAETYRYFQKLPGYDTLRLVLAEKVILVEGATEELLLQRAYMDKNTTADEAKLPQDDGIDIIAVNSLSFKRYCDIAAVIGKPVTVITDNDGSVDKNIKEKYKEYIENRLFTFLYETADKLCTIEPSVLAVNMKDKEPTDVFMEAISSKGSMKNKSRDEVLKFMSGHKTEWAMRVFESEQKINYPEYIEKAVQ
jgi:putative ATP-dependent endonuclease of OLD family